MKSGRPCEWEIDARVARAWNLSPADLEVMFEDFTLGALTSEYRQAFVQRPKGVADFMTSERPELLENITEETQHASALEFLSRDPGTANRPVSIATGYVNLGGIHHLAVTLTESEKTRLLLGTTPDPGLGCTIPP